MVYMNDTDLHGSATHYIESSLDIIFEHQILCSILESEKTSEQVMFGALESIEGVREQLDSAVSTLRNNFTQEQIFKCEAFIELKDWLFNYVSTTQAIQLITFSSEVLAALNIDQADLFSHSVGNPELELPKNMAYALDLADTILVKEQPRSLYLAS